MGSSEKSVQELGPLSRAGWRLGGAIRKVFSPLEFIFRIREDLSAFGRVGLVALFFLVVFGLWCWATNSPEWLNRGVERVFPDYKVQAGDAVHMTLNRATRQIHLKRAIGGREVVVDLPGITPSALPPFSPENYPGVFADLQGFGLGEFQKKDETTVTAKVVDLQRARVTGGFDPMPFQLPVAVDEPVGFTLDPLRGRLGLYLTRDSLRKAQVPYQGNPKKLEEASITDVAAQMGVSGPFQRKDDLTLLAKVQDVAKFRETTSLGPSNPVDPLVQGEELLVTFKPQEGGVSVELARTNKQRSVPVDGSKLSGAALPELGLAAYPKLAEALAGVGVEATMPAEGPPRLEARISDPARALSKGFGLFRPKEQRRVGSLPSPTEVADGLPSLWNDRNLMGGFGFSSSWPFITNLSWQRFKESALAVSLERIAIGFFFAVLVAVPLGILMGSFTKFGNFFEPLRIAGLYLPLPAFVPLTLFWAGIGEDQKYLYLFICNFVVLLPYTIVAIQSVPQVFLDTAATLGLTRAQTVRRVLIAVAKPEIFKALRFTFGVGWTWIILAEQIGVDNGLGYIIWTSERRSHPDHVYVVILLIMVLAFLINALWTWLINVLFPYERSR